MLRLSCIVAALSSSCSLVFSADKVLGDGGCEPNCPEAALCPDDADFTAILGDYCFAYYPTALTWRNARAACLERGGDVANLSLLATSAQATSESLVDALGTSATDPDPWLGVQPGFNNELVWTSDETPVLSQNWSGGAPEFVEDGARSARAVISLADSSWSAVDDSPQNTRAVLCVFGEAGPTLIDEENDRGYRLAYTTFGKFGSTWDDAREMCDHRGAELVEIEDQEEMDFIVAEFSNRTFWVGARGPAAPGDPPDWNSGTPVLSSLLDADSNFGADNACGSVRSSEGTIGSFPCGNGGSNMHVCEWASGSF